MVLCGWFEYFSNVPFVLVAGKWIPHFADPALMWKVLAVATTFAGNLTIIGSVANMIVVESAREHLQIGFWDYARFGIPITIVTTAAGIGVLLVALRNRRYSVRGRQWRAGGVKALGPPRSIQTTAVRERFALAQGDDTQKA